jgi:hypothetical protein
MNRLSGGLVPKLYEHVQQADAGSIRVNNGLRDSTLMLEPVQATLRFLELLLERFDVCIAVGETRDLAD